MNVVLFFLLTNRNVICIKLKTAMESFNICGIEDHKKVY